ncbi:MAG TPA: Gx transporter family protein [Acholeplasmataceae bacterium]|nr:Gx transporter family protein [Acholeplasmataceae bacterium]
MKYKGMKDVKRMAILANLVAVAIVLNLVEAQLNFIPVPGAKLGLANLVTMVVVYMFSPKEAIMVTLLRIIIVGLLSGRLFGPTTIMGFSGAIVSVIVMIMLKKINVFGVVLVSVISSMSHQVGQIIAGIFVIGSSDVIYYLPIMLPLGIVSGILIGIISERFIKVLENKF